MKQSAIFIVCTLFLLCNTRGYWDHNYNYDSDFRPNFGGFKYLFYLSSNPGEYVKSLIQKRNKGSFCDDKFKTSEEASSSSGNRNYRWRYDPESSSSSSSSKDSNDFFNDAYGSGSRYGRSYGNDYGNYYGNTYRGNSYCHGRHCGRCNQCSGRGIKNNPFFGNYFPF